MGSSYSSENLSPEINVSTNIEDSSSNISTKDDNLKNVDYIYLVKYNNDIFFTKNNEDIIDIVTSIKTQYVTLALKHLNLYSYNIYENVNKKSQKTSLEDTTLEKILSENVENGTKNMHEIYSLEVTKSIRNILINIESQLESLIVYKVYNLSNIFETESDEDEENEVSEDESEPEVVLENKKDN